MSTDDDDLRINTLHRFAKHSARLILHEYSHCEVPAGCGGVVLRWIDPASGAPARIDLVTPGCDGTTWLDGVEQTASTVLVRAGARVLALHLRRVKAGPHPFVCSVRYDSEPEIDLVSLGPARWVATTTRPGDEWTAHAFDDAAWTPLGPVAAGQRAPVDQRTGLRLDRAAARGQPIFQLDVDELWVRAHFEAAAR